MKKHYLTETGRDLPRKPRIPPAAIGGFIAGGVVVAAATAAVSYFFLRKKEITLRLCCDINERDTEAEDPIDSAESVEAAPADEVSAEEKAEDCPEQGECFR